MERPSVDPFGGANKYQISQKVRIDTGYDKYNPTNASLSGVFRIILILMLGVTIMRVTIGSTNIISFTGFLDMLRRAPSINTSWLTSFVTWGDSLTAIPLIGSALGFLSKIVSVALFGATGIIQIAIYSVYFMRFIFV